MSTVTGNLTPKTEPVLADAWRSHDDSHGKLKPPGSGRGVLQCISSIIPRGGLLSTTFNLASATLGGGVISLGTAFQMSGVVLSIVMLVIVTVCTVYSVGLMIQAVEITGYKSDAELSRRLFGRGWDYVTVTLTWIFTFGTCVGYVIAIGRLLEPVLSEPSLPEFWRSSAGNRIVTSAIWLVGMLCVSRFCRYQRHPYAINKAELEATKRLSVQQRRLPLMSVLFMSAKSAWVKAKCGYEFFFPSAGKGGPSSMLDKIKTFVSRQAGQKVGNALATSSGAPPTIKEAFNRALQMASTLFEEREWQCPCGHKFRASGEWVATVPIYCEVPSCPNPKYYVDGPGRALLEANPSGVKLQEVKDTSALPSSSSSSSSRGVGSRFNNRSK